MHARDILAVARPPAAVFRWIANPHLASRWQPDVASYEVTSPDDGGEGTEFTETLAGRDGSVELRGRIVAFSPNDLITFDLRGPGLNVVARYSIEPAGSGAVLRAEIDVEPSRPIPRLLRPLIRRRMARQLHRELQTLRRLCEAESTPEAEEDQDGESRDPLGDRRS